MAEKQPTSVENETAVDRNHASDTEKETAVPVAEVATKDRRKSHMSIEDPSSPTSSSRNSISTESDHERYSHESRGRTRPLAPQLSRTSSTGAIGGIHAVSSLNRTHTNRSVATNGTGSFDPSFEIDFVEGDTGDPQQWPIWYKGLILFVMSYGTTCVVLYSTSYTSAIPGMEATFGVGETVGVLGVTTYLFGMATGSVILAPLSEMFGRRPIYVVALALFVVFVIPCAVATNMATILVTRFFGAFCAAAMISNSPGTVNDIVDEQHRALAFSIWSIGPMNGPVIGPVVGGFVFQYLGWRWTNWVVVIVASVAWIVVSLIQETYAPAILRKRAAKKRKETGDERWWSRYDDKEEFWPLLKINLSRPFVMTVTEPICIFWDVYIALVYGILYLCFVAYPIVFSELRGWSPSMSGLAFCGIGVGSMIVIVSEPLIRKMINAHKPDPESETGDVPPEAMVSVVCIAAVLLPVGEMWFAWTGTPNVHWIWPILAGVPFGMGNAGVFIYATNYLVYSYDVYAASALAGNAVLRSAMGATIPLAGTAMYSTLGAHWAGTLLALLEAICIPIPFIFYRYGRKIRLKSALIRSMREDKEKQNARRTRAEEKTKRRLEAEARTGAVVEMGAAVDEGEKEYEKGGAVRETEE
ncbi:hypothetical protein LTR91_003028 [Friedmanniomyces endolithicus]|uniref:Cercosporin MFS transporter CTB4 n=2 Tax=Friedmanniomyces endolithicus TaxID=329885 RepID=A0AAN6R078_9PEZI|nr:hypothetical protein LTR91_003028 [Friedmanniomyces endolithicus]